MGRQRTRRYSSGNRTYVISSQAYFDYVFSRNHQGLIGWIAPRNRRKIPGRYQKIRWRIEVFHAPNASLKRLKTYLDGRWKPDAGTVEEMQKLDPIMRLRGLRGSRCPGRVSPKPSRKEKLRHQSVHTRGIRRPACYRTLGISKLSEPTIK